MKKRGKIQRDTDSVSVWKEVKEEKKKKIGKVFGSEIRFYLKFRFFPDNWTLRDEKPVTISIRKEGIFQPRLLAIDFTGIPVSIYRKLLLSNFLPSLLPFSFQFSRSKFKKMREKKKKSQNSIRFDSRTKNALKDKSDAFRQFSRSMNWYATEREKGKNSNRSRKTVQLND